MSRKLIVKTVIKTIKPRNPFVAASHRRVGGAHSGRHQRQGAQVALRSELALLERPQERHPHSN